MTADEAIGCLTAGVEEDEQNALAACAGPARLELDWKAVAYEVDLDSRRVYTVADSNGVFIAPELFRHSGHIARHDPARVLRQATVMREIIDAYRTAVAARDSQDQHAGNPFSAGSHAASVMWLDWVLDRLGTIYTDATEKLMSTEPTPGEKLDAALAKAKVAAAEAGVILAAQGAFGWALRGDMEKARTALCSLPPGKMFEVSAAAAALSVLAAEVSAAAR